MSIEFEADADFSGYDDDNTGIVMRTIEADGSSRYFDMNGRYLGTQQPKQQGVYVRDNKKVIIKSY